MDGWMDGWMGGWVMGPGMTEWSSCAAVYGVTRTCKNHEINQLPLYLFLDLMIAIYLWRPFARCPSHNHLLSSCSVAIFFFPLRCLLGKQSSFRQYSRLPAYISPDISNTIQI